MSRHFDDVVPVELAQWYPAFHGTPISEQFRVDDVDPDDFQYLGLLGRFRFLCYEPPPQSRHGELILIHHGGDFGAPGDAHARCTTCGMILFKKNVPHNKLPYVARTSRGTAVAILGHGLHVSEVGIKG